ncbi:MAG: aldo/keto reductase [Gammaproteobacteria bacterium]|nr:aldo/keto reductase [Gammaproteobacteria bacterium]
MDQVQLGRTGLMVGVAGLGCGGFSRLGQRQGRSEAESVALVRTALDEGVNFFDTAENYGTETIVGKALRDVDRDRVVISTKTVVARSGAVRPVAEIVASLNASLERLGMAHVDVFHLHAVPPALLDHVLEQVLPALQREQQAGKIRHLGITETAPNDPGHEMLARALPLDHFDVVMVAFHMLHQSARERVFPLTLANGVATLIMFAVREIFSKPARLTAELQRLAEDGQLDDALRDPERALGFLVHDGGARSLVDAAYRFCRHEPGADVILFGTGSVDHLRANIESICRPPLPAADLERLHKAFAHLTDVGLDAPSGG